jgi:hypothetical protein
MYRNTFRPSVIGATDDANDGIADIFLVELEKEMKD